MSESTFWDYVRPMMKGLDPIRIEDALALGVPDVNHRAGWIELKFVRFWPKRPKTKVAVEHYTPEQRAWHIRRCYVGGNCKVLIQIQDRVMLFWGDVAARELGRAPRARLEECCSHNWLHGGRPIRKELFHAILEERPKQRGLFDEGGGKTP